MKKQDLRTDAEKTSENELRLAHEAEREDDLLVVEAPTSVKAGALPICLRERLI